MAVVNTILHAKFLEQDNIIIIISIIIQIIIIIITSYYYNTKNNKQNILPTFDNLSFSIFKK